ncbi:MAG: ATP phosphoribosyltransferase [Abditibacteriota bacterium]|nr:ATP phosphoribosyltransferase [Abditibacteriota bacterium]
MLVKIALPKGSLQEATFHLFEKAGWNFSVRSRSYTPGVDDPEVDAILLRAQEIPRYVEMGAVDFGITGYDNVCECSADVVEVCELVYSKATSRPYRWVLAAPVDSDIKRAEDLEGKTVATELVNVTKKYFAEKGINVKVEFSWGATEVKVPELVDAIVEGTETGSTLKAHGLAILDEILVSTTRLICNKASWEDPVKREKIENMATMLQAALTAENLVGLKMNAPKEKTEAIVSILPALEKPTINELSDRGWVALEIIIDSKEVRNIVPKLKRAGASGIVEYPLSKVIF